MDRFGDAKNETFSISHFSFENEPLGAKDRRVRQKEPSFELRALNFVR